MEKWQMENYIKKSDAKINELEAVIKELRGINIKVIEKLAQCRVNFNFSQMDIKNTGENPCFEQNMNNMGFDFK